MKDDIRRKRSEEGYRGCERMIRNEYKLTVPNGGQQNKNSSDDLQPMVGVGNRRRRYMALEMDCSDIAKLAV